MAVVFVRGLHGHTLRVDGSAVAVVKQQLCETHGVLVEEQRLAYSGRLLGSCEPLSKFAESLELQGGGKKRKKKTYTKPKKIKHKMKKVKLSVLKFYKIDSSDKVTRLRRGCPQCGLGVRLAIHCK